MQELIGKVVTMPSRPNTPLRASSSLLCCTMSARKTFIISMPMVFRNGMRRTIERAMACALSVYLKNSVCHLRPMSVWPSGGIWGRETRCLRAIWWHMGAGNEMSQPDYPQEYAIAMQDPFCQLIHEADHMAAKQSDKETKEARFESLKWDAKRTLFRLKNGGGRFIFGAVRSEVYKHNLEIFKAWKFEAPSGKMIDLIGSRQQLLDATKVYREAVSASEIPPRYATTRTGCANEDCLVVAKQLIDLGLNPAVLNLADAYHACGMYNSGSGAQEESLCRASTLSLTLYQYYNKMWAGKAGVPLRPVSAYPMDIHFGGIYSPGVTVFRDNQDTGFALREEPYQTSIISLAALNFRSGHKTNNLDYCADDGGFTPEGEQVMHDKIRTIYRIALLNGHDSLVLGAFGCGVFQLKPELVAKYFKQVLDEDEFRGKFHTIVFYQQFGRF